MAFGSWIVAVGDELLSGHTADSNSHFLAGRLRDTPYPVARIVVVPDREEEIIEQLRSAEEHGAARVFCCGGLGPTPDDRTFSAVAAHFGVPLVEHGPTLERIRERVADLYRRGRLPSPEPNPGNRKMALVPKGAVVLPNPVGSAPPVAMPLAGEAGERWLLVLPGVPTELRPIVDQVVLPTYCAGGSALAWAEQRYTGAAESQFFPLLTELANTYPEVSFGSYPQAVPGELVIRACSPFSDRLELAMARLREAAPPR